MTRTGRFGAVVAVGAMTAGIALLSSLPTGARADELVDLKANQELLKERLDQLAIGAAPVAPGAPSLAGSFPRSFLIPGTDTSLLIGGYIKLDIEHTFSGGGPNGNAQTSLNGGAPITASAPLDLHGTGLFAPAFFNAHSRGSGITAFTAKESRLRVETRTPTAWGEAATVWEVDFYGCQVGGGAGDCNNLNQTTNSNLPRLRLAFGTLGGLIAGQAFIPVLDLAAQPETFDFGGDVGSFGYARAPQLGYKWALPWGASFGAWLVYPSTGVYTPAGGIDTEEQGGTVGTVIPNGGPIVTGLQVNPTKSVAPDGNFVLRFDQPWGHFQVSSVIQELELQDGHFITKDYVGYGGGFGIEVHPAWFGWTKDHLGAQFYAGNGLGRYASNPTGTQPFTVNNLSSNFGGASANGYGAVACTVATPTAVGCRASDAALVRASTNVQFGGEVNYQHWWLPNVRTNLTFGLWHQDLNTGLLGGPGAATFNMNKELVNAHANLIWSPVAFINTGIEYTYGHRDTLYNAKGDVHTLDFAFQVKF